MINDYSQGGLKMIDILSFNRSLNYLDTENGGSWKLFLRQNSKDMEVK